MTLDQDLSSANQLLSILEMQSHLTRQVFRRILYNEPCRHQFALSVIRTGSIGNHVFSHRRSIFGFARKPQRHLRSADLDPGLGKMLELNALATAHARTPPASELVPAFRSFFRAKVKSREPLQEIQARHVLRTFQHLQETNAAEGFGLDLQDLRIALGALTRVPKDKLEAHNQLARELFAEIERRERSDTEASRPEDVLSYVAVLCQTGSSLDARDVVEPMWRIDPDQNGRRMWLHVAEGFTLEENEEELLKSLSMMAEAGVPFDAKFHQVMTLFYALKDDAGRTREWYERSIVDGESPTYHTNAQLLRFCIRNDEMDWGETVFRRILEGTPDKRTWDVIFQWGAALGKGVDEVDRMMDVMIRRNKDEAVRPDIETINELIELANSRNDPYAAERYVALGQKRGMIPDARTYILQMDYRIKVGDLDGARVAYDALQGEEVRDGEDLPVINRLIRALCASKRPPHSTITAMVTDLGERRARLDPPTVSALCTMHLQREELYDVHDLLQSHTFHYSIAERASLISVFVDFVLDRQNPNALAWDAYSILRQGFDETSVAQRTQLMKEFFGRRRSDMACHVFGHMRQSFQPDGRPVLATYIECLTGIARAADLEGLEMVHNMLKLDSAIEPTTQLYNVLMLAYTAADMPLRSLEFWEDILRSRQGPSYASIIIALQACEGAPFGERQARAIWQRLMKMPEVTISREVAAAYVGALAGQGELKEVIKGLEELGEIGIEVDVSILGTMYNAMPGQNRKDRVEEWAQQRYPDAWKEVQGLGQTSLKDGSRLFRLERDVDP
ncbi:MAG: hypothetical protein M1838_002987 [Thelocarpon superellum]|nr:MAG: hypothetical protein M1838_002987 [Thelocarpon superellum]